MTETSNFNQRSDIAAKNLKGMLSQQLEQRYGERGPHGRGSQIPEREVAVDGDGKERQAPPPGSYAEMADRQAQQQAQPTQPPAQPAQVEAEQPPQGNVETQPQPQEPAPEPISENANKRIRQLVDQLREKDRDLAAVQAEQTSYSSTIKDLQGQLGGLQQQHKQVLEQTLDSMDPETRFAVMQDARLQDAIGASERKILGLLEKGFTRLQDKENQQDLAALADRYPGFDYDRHPAAIREVISRNPSLSVEMAWRAVASDSDLGVGSARPSAAVPPVLPPGNGPSQPRSIPHIEQPVDENKQLVDQAAAARDLLRSTSQADQKKGMDLLHQNLKGRLFGG